MKTSWKMRLAATLGLFLALALPLRAQFLITSVTPSDGAAGLPGAVSVCLTFNAALDTTQRFTVNGGDEAVLPVQALIAEPEDGIGMTGWTWSGGTNTLCLELTLAAGHDYYFLVDRAISAQGAELDAPRDLHLSRLPAMGERQVQGQVARLDGESPFGAVVGLFDAPPFDEDDAQLMAGTVVLDPAGSYTIPYVRPGLYYPITALDLDGDGNISTEAGDLIGYLDADEDGEPDAIVVGGEDVDGIDMLLFSMSLSPFLAREGLEEARQLAAEHAMVTDAELRAVLSIGETVEDNGRSMGWGYQFYSPTLTAYIMVIHFTHISWVEIGGSDWPPMATLPEVFIDSDAAMSIALNNGGWEVEESLSDDMRWAMAGNFHWLWPEDPTLPLWAVHFAGWFNGTQWQDHVFVINAVTGEFLGSWDENSALPTPGPLVPSSLVLGDPWPNPFNPIVHIPFELTSPGDVHLTVHNLAGQVVAELVRGVVPSGRHQLVWDAAGLAGGLYLVRLERDGRVEMRKALLLK
jgi:hypothetical protein